MSTDDEWYKPAETILLTGAGFTKNYRGYLASEMWAAILNQPEVSQDYDLRKVMLKELDFEEIYDMIMKQPEDKDGQKSTFRKAITNAYQQMHESICTGDVFPNHLNWAAAVCRHLISRFAGSIEKRTSGFFFTVNQDLFVERFYSNEDTRKLIGIPGFRQESPNWFYLRLGAQLRPEDWVKLPDKDWVKQIETKFWSKSFYRPLTYIKLHGSYGWNFHDGTPGIVIGHAKSDLLKKEPLFDWYQSLFKRVLSEGNRRLVVIGYGFNDEHINSVIADAIKYKGLKLYAVYPYPPKDFQRELGAYIVNGFVNPKPHCEKLWDGLTGYFPFKVSDLYDQDSVNRIRPEGRPFFHAIGLA